MSAPELGTQCPRWEGSSHTTLEAQSLQEIRHQLTSDPKTSVPSVCQTQMPQGKH